MRQDYFVFLDVLKETVAYYFAWDLSEWWGNLSESGTEKFWIAGIVIVLVLLLAGGFFHWIFRYVSYCLIGCFVGVVLVAGESPSMETMTLVILYITGTMAAGTGKRRWLKLGSTVIILALSGVLLFASSQVGVPLLKKAFGDVMPLRTKIQNTSLAHVINDLLPEELKFQDGTGEYEGGSLETQENGPEFTGRTVISVEIDKLPESTYYWARYTGNVYTGYSFNQQGNLDNPKNPANIRYPSSVLSDLEAFCKENPKESPEEIRDFIVNTLAEYTTYNLKVGPVPEGEDFIEYFFFKQREGYCIHYAATAVMMFRMYGIPARYVTGFLIPPSMFYLNEAGIYQADVPDDQAHAWVEAYIDGRWVTVEATPPRGVPLEAGGEQETETAAAGESEAEGMTETNGGGTEGVENTETENAASENGGGSSNQIAPAVPESVTTESTIPEDMALEDVLPESLMPSWIFLPVILLLALILVFVGLFLRRLFVLEKRKKESVQEIFANMYEVLCQGGLKPGLSILSDDFGAEILIEFPWIREDELFEVLEIVLRTTYGPLPAAEEERRKVQKLYYQICRQMGKSRKGMSKFAFYLVDVWI